MNKVVIPSFVKLVGDIWGRLGLVETSWLGWREIIVFCQKCCDAGWLHFRVVRIWDSKFCCCLFNGFDHRDTNENLSSSYRSCFRILMKSHSVPTDLVPWSAPCIGNFLFEYYLLDTPRDVCTRCLDSFNVLTLSLYPLCRVPIHWLLINEWLAIIWL